MEANEQGKLETADFSQFKWAGFIPGKSKVDDLSVLKFHGDIRKLDIPENFSPATYTLQFIKSGTMKVDINNQIHELSANSGYFIAPGFLVRHPNAEGYPEMYIVSFTMDFIQELHLPFSLVQIAHIYSRPVWRMSAQKMQRIEHYCELLREVCDEKNREAAAQLLKSMIFYLAGDMTSAATQQTQLSRNEEITGKFLVLVDANYAQQHSLDWYASELCLSARYIANTIKQTLGMTASSCIERALTHRAKTLLSTSTTPIAEIAEMLGFQNQSHFGTFFKRQAGVSPSAYRTQYHS
ncbi:MAG: helix-turn-helix transcriptional regulator [Bacteroidales bacterium]|nr:helix-turn-helix transcriptional regulator [Bacteroidales bacterium]